MILSGRHTHDASQALATAKAKAELPATGRIKFLRSQVVIVLEEAIDQLRERQPDRRGQEWAQEY
jgi:hypothetical protein